MRHTHVSVLPSHLPIARAGRSMLPVTSVITGFSSCDRTGAGTLFSIKGPESNYLRLRGLSQLLNSAVVV